MHIFFSWKYYPEESQAQHGGSWSGGEGGPLFSKDPPTVLGSWDFWTDIQWQNQISSGAYLNSILSLFSRLDWGIGATFFPVRYVRCLRSGFLLPTPLVDFHSWVGIWIQISCVLWHLLSTTPPQLSISALAGNWRSGLGSDLGWPSNVSRKGGGC